jgi:hypothetical protein
MSVHAPANTQLTTARYPDDAQPRAIARQTAKGRPMSHRYTSFLLRHWQLAEGELRITVEHIQTGAAITVASLEAATRWLGEQAVPASPCELTRLNLDPAAEPTGDLTLGPAP